MKSSLDKVKIHNEVIVSGKFNYAGCKIPVNEKIDTQFMRRMLQGYNDLLVCDLLRFGFPIELNQDDSSKLFSFQPSIVTNHSGAQFFS
jgi:hypothetical protein